MDFPGKLWKFNKYLKTKLNNKEASYGMKVVVA